MRKWNKIRVNTKVDNWRYIPAEMNNSGILSYVVLFDKFRLLSTCLTGPEFLAPNNQKYDFEGLKEETSADEVRIKTIENRESNVNISVSNVNPKNVSTINILEIFFVIDQNETTCRKDNKTKIQLVEMETKTIKPRKLRLFIVERTKRDRNIPTSKITTSYIQDKFNKLLHNKVKEKGSNN